MLVQLLPVLHIFPDESGGLGSRLDLYVSWLSLSLRWLLSDFSVPCQRFSFDWQQNMRYDGYRRSQLLGHVCCEGDERTDNFVHFVVQCMLILR